MIAKQDSSDAELTEEFSLARFIQAANQKRTGELSLDELAAYSENFVHVNVQEVFSVTTERRYRSC